MIFILFKAKNFASRLSLLEQNGSQAYEKPSTHFINSQLLCTHRLRGLPLYI